MQYQTQIKADIIDLRELPPLLTLLSSEVVYSSQMNRILDSSKPVGQEAYPRTERSTKGRSHRSETFLIGQLIDKSNFALKLTEVRSLFPVNYRCQSADINVALYCTKIISIKCHQVL